MKKNIKYMKIEFNGKEYEIEKFIDKNKLQKCQVYYPKVLTQEKANILFENAFRPFVNQIIDKRLKIYKRV